LKAQRKMEEMKRRLAEKRRTASPSVARKEDDEKKVRDVKSMCAHIDIGEGRGGEEGQGGGRSQG